MPRMTRGANRRSKKPPIPPAPGQVVAIRTRDLASWGVTVVVVTRLEAVSDSVRTRPGSGSATVIRSWRVRPPAVTLNRVIVPAPTPPDSTWKSENAGGRKCGWCPRMSAMYPYTAPAGASTVRSAETRIVAMEPVYHRPPSPKDALRDTRPCRRRDLREMRLNTADHHCLAAVSAGSRPGCGSGLSRTDSSERRCDLLDRLGLSGAHALLFLLVRCRDLARQGDAEAPVLVEFSGRCLAREQRHRVAEVLQPVLPEKIGRA